MLNRFVFIMFLLISGIVNAADFKEIAIDFPDGASNNPVKLVFLGKIYDEKYHYSYMKKRVKQAKASKVETTIYNMVETYRSTKDKKDILKLWSVDDKDTISKKFSDKGLIEKNAAFYRNLSDTKLVATMLYGDVVLVFVTHTIENSDFKPFIQVYPMIESDDVYLLTNKLKRDMFFTSFSSFVGDMILKKYQ